MRWLREKSDLCPRRLVIDPYPSVHQSDVPNELPGDSVERQIRRTRDARGETGRETDAPDSLSPYAFLAPTAASQALKDLKIKENSIQFSLQKHDDRVISCL